MTDQLDRLFRPDGANLNVMLWGQAGSGKSVFIEQSLQHFIRANKDPQLRILIVSPKNEGFEFGEIVHGVDALEKSIAKHRVTVLYPVMDDLEQTVDDSINLIFDFQAANPKASFVFVLDDAQVFLSSRKAASDAHKRLALTGRSRKIKGIYVAHNIVFARELEGQIDVLVGFSNPSPIYYKAAKERFNFDPSQYADALRSKPYSFVWFDIREHEPRLMEPIEIKDFRVKDNKIKQE